MHHAVRFAYSILTGMQHTAWIQTGGSSNNRVGRRGRGKKEE